MKTFKKHLATYRINRQIRHLQQEATSSDFIAPYNYIANVPYATVPSFGKPSEKSEIIRRSINDLLEQRDKIRAS